MFRLSFAEAIQLVNRTEYLPSRIKHRILRTAKNKRAVFTPLLCNICMKHMPRTFERYMYLLRRSCIVVYICISVHVYMCIHAYTYVMRLPRAAITLRCVIRARSFSCLSESHLVPFTFFSYA